MSSGQVDKMPQKAGPQESVKKFLADLRTSYQARKKNKLPMEKKRRQLSIGYFILAFFTILMIQNYFGSAHVEIISYSQFKSLLKKDLINDLAIGETTIDGNLKGAAVKEIFAPEKVKKISPEIVEGKKLLPFETVRVEDPGLTAELEAAKVPFKGAGDQQLASDHLILGGSSGAIFSAVELYWQEDGFRKRRLNADR